MPLRIVAADDEHDTAEFFREALTRLGHEVAVAEDGRQLVELCRSVHPDLVITDVEMPGMSGLEAVEQVWQEMPVRVVVVSARPRQLPAGGRVVLFLEKPVDLAGLERAVAIATARPVPAYPLDGE